MRSSQNNLWFMDSISCIPSLSYVEEQVLSQWCRNNCSTLNLPRKHEFPVVDSGFVHAMPIVTSTHGSIFRQTMARPRIVLSKTKRMRGTAILGISFALDSGLASWLCRLNICSTYLVKGSRGNVSIHTDSRPSMFVTT
jgi:hypothetical protein